MELEFSPQIVEMFSNSKFNFKNPFLREPRCYATCGQTDGHDKVNSCFSQFCERAKKYHNIGVHFGIILFLTYFTFKIFITRAGQTTHLHGV
jgi:hypothetical protein